MCTLNIYFEKHKEYLILQYYFTDFCSYRNLESCGGCNS